MPIQVAVVTAGLVLRAIGNLASAQRLVGADADMMWGLAYIMASAAGYSLLGVVYEVRAAYLLLPPALAGLVHQTITLAAPSCKPTLALTSEA